MKEEKNNYITLWLTGLSGSGKSTLAQRVQQCYTDFVILDGDVLREGLCSDLGFDIKDREENMRRLIEVCKLFNKNKQDVIAAFISPLEKWRKRAKERIPHCYIIYVDCPLDVCESRDTKGLYKKARTGTIPNFTGIDSPFEEPENPDLIVDTNMEPEDLSVEKVLKFYDDVFQELYEIEPGL